MIAPPTRGIGRETAVHSLGAPGGKRIRDPVGHKVVTRPSDRAGTCACRKSLGPSCADAGTVRGSVQSQVYGWCMTRTNIDLDDTACDAVMRRYDLATKREAVNFALRTVAGEALGLDEARRLRGSGWDGDLEKLRASRA